MPTYAFGFFIGDYVGLSSGATGFTTPFVQTGSSEENRTNVFSAALAPDRFYLFVEHPDVKRDGADQWLSIKARATRSRSRPAGRPDG